MDEQIKQRIEKLKEMGLDEKKIYSLMMLGFEDFLDEVQDDLVQAGEADMNDLLKEVENATSSEMTNEEKTKFLENSLRRIYGITAEGKWKTFLTEYLDKCIKDAEYVKDFITRLNNNDPEALKQVILAQQDPDFELTKKAIEQVSKEE